MKYKYMITRFNTALNDRLLRQTVFIQRIVFFILLSSFNFSCKKFVEVEAPKSQIVSSNVFTNDATAIAAITGIYSEMMNNSGFASGNNTSVSFLSGASADELISFSDVAFGSNSLVPTNGTLRESVWGPPYQYIRYANAVLEGLENSSGVSAATKNQLIGEAKFIRAFCHFYLVNLFGDVPLITTTDYRVNRAASRTPVDEVYQQIVTDLKDAQDLLSADYSFSDGERVRPNKWVATALLARVYLYTGDWSKAETLATTIINNTAMYSLTTLDAVFIKNSSEAIWQLMPVIPGLNTLEGYFFTLSGTPGYVSINSILIDAFETNDARKTNWVSSVTVGPTTYYYPTKYKVQLGSSLTEYSMVFRLAEQYLIRAEARAQQNKLLGPNSAESDINIIRNRAGLGNTTATTQADLLEAVMQERRVELFTEWGHRWLDLKRTNRADAVLAPIKSDWQPTDKLYPIPQSEINTDSHLTQNPGYN